MRTLELPDIVKIGKGKVREIFELEEGLLLVATDRISAFDVVLPDEVPKKGAVLTQLSRFWFHRLVDVVDNHLISADVDDFPDSLKPYTKELAQRSMLVRKCRPLPIECVVRGYMAGSGWKEYQKTGSICGISLPPGLVESEKFPEPIFTPSTKAEEGHDENISFEEAENLIGRDLARQVREVSLNLYMNAADYARELGIIICDTKFEFGLAGPQLLLIDEALTPDSSRFWPEDQYVPGRSQPSFDKQYIRDYLEKLEWDKQAPGPRLPEAVIRATTDRYVEAYERITGTRLAV